MTGRQAQVIAYIKKFTKEHGYQPNQREIADHFGMASANAVHCHLKALARKGFIEIRGARAVAIFNDEISDV